MPSTKRALQETNDNPVKRIRLSRDELEDLEKEQLILKVLDLQSKLEDAINATVKTAAAANAGSPDGTVVMSDEQAQQKAEQARKLMVKGIKSQMKWKPSCKQGAAKFSYSGALPSVGVFYKLMAQPSDSKKKMLSFTPTEFEDIADESICVSARYNNMNITGAKVNVKWKEDEGAFSVNGSYGV